MNRIGRRRWIKVERHGATFLIRWDAGDEEAVLRYVAEQAKRPDSILTWYDAAVISQRVRTRYLNQ